jgi:type IV secretion system protein VirB1
LLPGMELMACQGLAVPTEVMHHVVRVESSYNPYAIGVVGGRLVRQPKNLPEALATVRMLESRGFNFSIGLAQVNRYNLDKYGLDSYEKAFEPCANLTAGSKILAECYRRANGDWGKSFSCYYSGNFSTGYRHGYVQKIYASIRQGRAVDAAPAAPAIEVVGRAARRSVPVSRHPLYEGAAPAAAAVADVPAMPTAMPTATASAPPMRRDRVSARIAPTSRVESSVEAAAPAVPSASPEPQPVVQAVAAPPPMPANVAIARAVPASSQVGVARAVVAEPAPAPEPQAAKRRDRASDKAFVASNPDQDDAFVF